MTTVGAGAIVFEDGVGLWVARLLLLVLKLSKTPFKIGVMNMSMSC